MKKTLVLLAFILAVSTVKAQVEYLVFAGPQITSSRYGLNNQLMENKAKYGFHAGAGIKMPFENRLQFAPTLAYSMKGYNVNLTIPAFPPDTSAIANDTRIHTIELSVLLQYDFSLDANHFFIKAGPSVDFQVSGKEKFTKKNNTVVERDMVFSFGDYGRYAASMQLHFGFESKSGLFVSAHYGHGIGSINNADLGPRIRHRVYGLSVGMFLNSKKIIIDTRNKQ